MTSNENGHRLDLEVGDRRNSFRKYTAENEDCNGGHPYTEDRVSVLSSSSFRQRGGSVSASETPKLPWYKGVTCHDIRAIMPTVLILLGGLLIMIFVIPYAFSTVIKQLQAEEVLEQRRLTEVERTPNATEPSSTTLAWNPSFQPSGYSLEASNSSLIHSSTSSTYAPLESDT